MHSLKLMGYIQKNSQKYQCFNLRILRRASVFLLAFVCVSLQFQLKRRYEHKWCRWVGVAGLAFPSTRFLGSKSCQVFNLLNWNSKTFFHQIWEHFKLHKSCNVGCIFSSYCYSKEVIYNLHCGQYLPHDSQRDRKTWTKLTLEKQRRTADLQYRIRGLSMSRSSIVLLRLKWCSY